MIRILILSILLSSCGASYHLKQAKRHLLLAEAKGAKIERDTVYKEVLLPSVRVDTVVSNVTVEKLLRDTITVIQNGQIVKFKYLEKEKKVFINVTTIKPKIVRVPYAVTTKISAGYSLWDFIIGVIVALIVGFVIGYVYRAFFSK